MKKYLVILFALHFSVLAFAQNDSKKVVVTGSVQSDMMIGPMQDAAIGTEEYDNEYFLTNTYADVMLQSKYINAGARFELTQWPMPGFDDQNNKFKGHGIPNLWIKAKLKKIDITAGSFYEQFGSGFVLRTYEERTLGIDNSLLGIRFVTTPIKGLTLKALTGTQRHYWELSKSLITGADVEFGLENYINRWQKSGTHLTFGLSYVNKWEKDIDDGPSKFDNVAGDEHVHRFRLNYPTFVNAVDARIRYQKNGLNLLGEYAWKSSDPNATNYYTYNNGHAEMLSASWSGKGISLLGQVKRSENMGFRSLRCAPTLDRVMNVNHLPAFTVDQTYALAAMYPYATQSEGEWAYQAGIGYKFKGRNKPKFKINYSRVQGLENSANCRVLGVKTLAGTDGLSNSFWKNGDLYYQDLDLMYEHKINKIYEHHFMFMYQIYNKTIIEGEGGNIKSFILVYEPKFKLSKKCILRCEAQTLLTAHESDNWYFALAELSVAPYLMFTVSDQIGRPVPLSGQTEYGSYQNYYNFSVTGNYKSHRLQLSFGRTRAGMNCTGGVCRRVPASMGFKLSYNYNF